MSRDHYLNYGILTIQKVISLEKCIEECEEWGFDCRSFSFSERASECIINNLKRGDVNGASYVFKKGFIYYERVQLMREQTPNITLGQWRNKGESGSAIPRGPRPMSILRGPHPFTAKNCIAFFRKICFLLNVQSLLGQTKVPIVERCPSQRGY